MKLTYLGTAAAEGIPGLFCDCENCRYAREHGGKEIRTRSQAIVNDDLLIDFPADALMHANLYSVDYGKVSHLLITHDHDDHWIPRELTYLHTGFSHPSEDYPGLTVYGSADIKAKFDAVMPPDGKVRVTVTEPYAPFAVGRYTVTALRANHGGGNPYNYIISDGKKTLLYAHDTDVYKEETLAYLAETDLHFDLVSLDCTEAARESMNYEGHMCLTTDRKMIADLRERGCIDDTTKIVLNHFTHNTPVVGYEVFGKIAARDGFLVSYDGMTVEL